MVNNYAERIKDGTLVAAIANGELEPAPLQWWDTNFDFELGSDRWIATSELSEEMCAWMSKAAPYLIEDLDMSWTDICELIRREMESNLKFQMETLKRSFHA